MEPLIGEIKLFAGNFAPRGWAFCNGQLLPISQNQALFSILGTTYGGDGRTTFALPDLRGRVPVHPGTGPGLSSKSLGEQGGTETETLSTQQLPAHTHSYDDAASDGTVSRSGASKFFYPVPKSWGVEVPLRGKTTVTERTETSGQAGSGQPHNNLPPYLGIHYIIALQGIFPSRN